MGGYDSRLPIMEDADLCIRLHMAGALHGRAWLAEQGLGPCRSVFGASVQPGCSAAGASPPAIDSNVLWLQTRRTCIFF